MRDISFHCSSYQNGCKGTEELGNRNEEWGIICLSERFFEQN